MKKYITDERTGLKYELVVASQMTASVMACYRVGTNFTKKLRKQNACEVQYGYIYLDII